MSEPANAPTAAATPSAGRLLREARERQGLHIAALAASIKVTPKKLELLEADRFDALPDTTFTRALAQTVCRALKIDSAPVLALLPPPLHHRLDHVSQGLNAPFRERPGALVQREDGALSYVNRTLNLAPSATERDLELTYSRPLGAAAKLSGALMLRINPGHDASSPRDMLLGVRYGRKF